MSICKSSFATSRLNFSISTFSSFFQNLSSSIVSLTSRLPDDYLLAIFCIEWSDVFFLRVSEASLFFNDNLDDFSSGFLNACFELELDGGFFTPYVCFVNKPEPPGLFYGLTWTFGGFCFYCTSFFCFSISRFLSLLFLYLSQWYLILIWAEV